MRCMNQAIAAWPPWVVGGAGGWADGSRQVQPMAVARRRRLVCGHAGDWRCWAGRTSGAAQESVQAGLTTATMARQNAGVGWRQRRAWLAGWLAGRAAARVWCRPCRAGWQALACPRGWWQRAAEAGGSVPQRLVSACRSAAASGCTGIRCHLMHRRGTNLPQPTCRSIPATARQRNSAAISWVHCTRRAASWCTPPRAAAAAPAPARRWTPAAWTSASLRTPTSRRRRRRGRRPRARASSSARPR